MRKLTTMKFVELVKGKFPVKSPSFVSRVR
jgi:hypothetical protein